MAARQQVGVTVIYDGSYRALDYPGGDVPPERGVCTDVIVRALRTARSLDLQKLVHEDMAGALRRLSKQPLGTRRSPTPTSITGACRISWSTSSARAMRSRSRSAAADYLPGDLVAWDLGGGILHIGIVSDRQAATGVPLVIHNIGAGAREEDILFRYTIIGHYRLPRDAGRPGIDDLVRHACRRTLTPLRAAIHGRLRAP